MAFVNRCIFLPTAGGTGTWTVSIAATGYLTPAQAGAVNTSTYSYAAELRDGGGTVTAWEVGTGTYTVAGTTLTRTVLLSSNANALVNFATPPQIMLCILANDFVAKTGDTMTGDLAIDKTAGLFTLKQAAASDTLFPAICWDVGSEHRWAISALWTVESGANVGSGFSIDAYDDDGVYLNTLLMMTRLGAMMIPNNLCIGAFDTLSGRTLTLSSVGQPAFAFRSTGAAATEQVLGWVFDGGVSLSDPGLVVQTLGDDGSFVSNNAVFWRDGTQTIGSITKYAGSQMVFEADRALRFNNATSSAGANVGTLANAPAAGNPTHWLRISIAGTNFAIPCWPG